MNPRVAKNIVELIREVPDLAREFAHVLSRMATARTVATKAVTKADIAKFNTLAVKELSGKSNPHKVISDLRQHFITYSDKIHAAGKGRPGKIDAPIAVPDPNNTKNVLRMPVADSKFLHISLGRKQKHVEGGPIVLGKNAGRAGKVRREMVPDDSDVVAIKIGGKGELTDKWIFARYDADKNVYKPVSPDRGPGKGHQFFDKVEDLEQVGARFNNRRKEDIEPIVAESLDAVGGQSHEQAGKFKSPGMGRGPVQHLLAKESHEAKLREPSHLESRHPEINERAVQRGLKNWETKTTGVDAPRVQTRKLNDEGRPRRLDSPFPDPRSTRYGEDLPREPQNRMTIREQKGRPDAIETPAGSIPDDKRRSTIFRRGGDGGIAPPANTREHAERVYLEREKPEYRTDTRTRKEQSRLETVDADPTEGDHTHVVAGQVLDQMRDAGMPKREIERILKTIGLPPERRIASPFPSRLRPDRENAETGLDRVLRSHGLGHGPARFDSSRSKFTSKTESLEQLLLRLKLGGGTPFTPKP